MMNLLLPLLLSMPSVRPATGISVGVGTGLTYLAESGTGRSRHTLGSVPLELAVVHHRGVQWFQAGLSWMYGASTATDSRPVKAHLFGLHADLSRSVLSYDYADIKLGAGVVGHYASVELGDWDGGPAGAPASRNREVRHQFLASARAYPSLLLHGSAGGGGLEVVPLRLEYGPSLFQVAPSVSYILLF